MAVPPTLQYIIPETVSGFAGDAAPSVPTDVVVNGSGISAGDILRFYPPDPTAAPVNSPALTLASGTTVYTCKIPAKTFLVGGNPVDGTWTVRVIHTSDQSNSNPLNFVVGRQVVSDNVVTGKVLQVALSHLNDIASDSDKNRGDPGRMAATSLDVHLLVQSDADLGLTYLTIEDFGNKPDLQSFSITINNPATTFVLTITTNGKSKDTSPIPVKPSPADSKYYLGVLAGHSNVSVQLDGSGNININLPQDIDLAAKTNVTVNSLPSAVGTIISTSRNALLFHSLMAASQLNSASHTFHYESTRVDQDRSTNDHTTGLFKNILTQITRL